MKNWSWTTHACEVLVHASEGQAGDVLVFQLSSVDKGSSLTTSLSITLAVSTFGASTATAGAFSCSSSPTTLGGPAQRQKGMAACQNCTMACKKLRSILCPTQRHLRAGDSLFLPDAAAAAAWTWTLPGHQWTLLLESAAQWVQEWWCRCSYGGGLQGGTRSSGEQQRTQASTRGHSGGVLHQDVRTREGAATTHTKEHTLPCLISHSTTQKHPVVNCSCNQHVDPSRQPHLIVYTTD